KQISTVKKSPAVGPERRGQQLLPVDQISILRIITPGIAYRHGVGYIPMTDHDGIALDNSVSPDKPAVLPSDGKVSQWLPVPACQSSADLLKKEHDPAVLDFHTLIGGSEARRVGKSGRSR